MNLDLVLHDKSLSHKELLDKAEELPKIFEHLFCEYFVEEPELNLFPASSNGKF